jgi:hypothetical protein
MKSFNLTVLNVVEYWHGPLDVPYMFSIPHNNDAKIKYEGKSIFEYEESS